MNENPLQPNNPTNIQSIDISLFKSKKNDLMGACTSSNAECPIDAPESLHRSETPVHEMSNYKNELLRCTDFEIMSFVQTGGLGKVYCGKYLPENKIVALKFFGYTSRKPNNGDIYKEINLMMALKGIEGIVQLNGVFMDTEDGMIGSKKFKVSYPVISMEMLAGGELFERIIQSEIASEKQLAKLFKGIIIALNEVHERGFIHRDLKLENLMYASKEEDAPLKIIDFGMMVRMDERNSIYIGDNVQGTPGYIAPESIIKLEYSPKTDLWQAGCCLYSMLSGYMAFDPDNLDQVTFGTYKPMIGKGWDNISKEAKDLIHAILNRDANKRLSAKEILAHSWVNGSTAPDVNLGTSYFARIKALGLRQKLRLFFIEGNISEANRKRRENLVSVLPFLVEGMDDRVENQLDRVKGHQAKAVEVRKELGTFKDPNFLIKLKKLKEIVVHSVSPHSPMNIIKNSESVRIRLESSGGSNLERGDGESLDASNHAKSENGSSSGRHDGSKHSIEDLRYSEWRTFSNESEKRTFSNESDDLDVLRIRSSSLMQTPIKGNHKGIYSVTEPEDESEMTPTHHNKATYDMMSSSSSARETELSYDGFVALLQSADLPELAVPQVFHIFDYNNTGKLHSHILDSIIAFSLCSSVYVFEGSIDIKEFLLTMLAFRPVNTTKIDDMRAPEQSIKTGEQSIVDSSRNDTEKSTQLVTDNKENATFDINKILLDDSQIDAARLYFNMFDMKETGYIDLEELKLVVGCLMVDEINDLNSLEALDNHPASVKNIEYLFNTIDLAKNGRIDFDEFKIFYNTIMLTSTKLNLPSANHLSAAIAAQQHKKTQV